MEIGLFLMPAHPPERSLYDATQWDLEIIELADRLGYVIATGETPAQAEASAEAYVRASTVHLQSESVAADPAKAARRRVATGLLHAGWPA